MARNVENNKKLGMLDQVVERAKREIVADIASGRVPGTVSSFSELHDYVDANYYGGAFEPTAHDIYDTDFWNEVQDTLNDWIAAADGLQHAIR